MLSAKFDYLSENELQVTNYVAAPIYKLSSDLL